MKRHTRRLPEQQPHSPSPPLTTQVDQPHPSALVPFDLTGTIAATLQPGVQTSKKPPPRDAPQYELKPLEHQHYARNPRGRADGSDRRRDAESDLPSPGRPFPVQAPLNHKQLSRSSRRPRSCRWQCCGLAGGRRSPDTAEDQLKKQQRNAVDSLLKKNFLGRGRVVRERETPSE